MNRMIDIAGTTYGYDELVHYTVASKIIGVSARTVRHMGSTGAIPVYRMSKRNNRFLVADLMKYSELRRVEATSQH